MHTERLRRTIRGTLMPGFAGFTPPTWLIDALNDGLQSTCVYGENVADTAQLQALGNALREAAPQAILAIDEEGGEVTRLHYLTGAPYPGAAVLGRINNSEYTAEIGARVGYDILEAGFNLALAPDADVNSNPENPVIGTRSFGADPELASKHTAAWVRGLQRTGAQACPKHFPGHGDTTQDSHLALPVVDVPLSLLEQRDLPPFRAAIEAGARAIMTSHILLPQLDPVNPATLSQTILQGLLREQLGFTGVIVSDALDMRGRVARLGSRRQPCEH
ncbi:glycoside hydrolase family 3 N-terminal domain-containing protein [Leucobacter coleopterorum]|uniref:glycoside hydrolase family 3 N-terminal domain-containing protein n=1 Tax=Leucobacter coleopterorum TaxID=2714933 RepID=UPI00244E4F36|nr:glycoside hydrolase family 3 N-terminal domain-containing protein [Leucobacter coleopterorum]